MGNVIVSTSLINSLFVGYNASFQKGLTGAMPWWSKLATKTQSTTKKQLFAWLLGGAKLRKWVDERKIQRLKAGDYTLTNEKWEQTVGVSREDIEDDTAGLYASNFEEMGQQFAKFPDYQLYPLLKNGTSNLCWDGKAFFADDHKVNPFVDDSPTFDNNRTSCSLTEDNFNTVFADMQSIKGPNDEPMDITPDAVIVPPALRATAQKIVNAPLIINSSGNAAATNVNQGIVQVVVIPELAGQDTTWYLAKLGGAIKPLVYQSRIEEPLTQLTAVNDQNVFMYDEYLYGSRVRAAFGYALPQLMTRCIA